MVIARFDSREEDVIKIINQIAEICITKEFTDLKAELESIYFKNGIENALLTAFQDALYAVWTQEEGARSRTLIY